MKTHTNNYSILFEEKSIAVGNKNISITLSELEKQIEKINFSYSYLPCLNILKDTKTGEKGIDNAIVEVDYAIAETGSVVIDSKDENKRLATCLANKLYAVLPLSKIKENLHDLADFLEEKTCLDGGYIAFITGASRTADIERVLTVGVHGPIEMTVFIITDL
jgi:L-lactate dehydrogenase complex protein LldG